MNGERTISAELMVAGKDEPYRSGAHAREFDNDDGYVVRADLGDNSAIGDDGRQWYGGPGNGTIDITALPVSYSGGSVTSVSANFCRKDAHGFGRGRWLHVRVCMRGPREHGHW